MYWKYSKLTNLQEDSTASSVTLKLNTIKSCISVIPPSSSFRVQYLMNFLIFNPSVFFK